MARMRKIAPALPPGTDPLTEARRLADDTLSICVRGLGGQMQSKAALRRVGHACAEIVALLREVQADEEQHLRGRRPPLIAP